jgi:hypothetical protein
MKTRLLLLAMGAFAMLTAGPAFSYQRSYSVGSTYHQFNPGEGHRYTPTEYWVGPNAKITIEDDGNGTSTTLREWTFHNKLETTFDATGVTGAPPNTTFAFIIVDGTVTLNSQPVGVGTMAGGSIDWGAVTPFINPPEHKGIYCESIPPTSITLFPTSCPAGSGLIDGGWDSGPPPLTTQDFGPMTIGSSEQSYNVSACPGTHPDQTDCYYSYITLSGSNWGRHEGVNGEQILTPTPMLAPLLALGGLGGSLAYMGGRVLRRRNED